MTNLLEQAINCDDPDQAAKIIRDALGIESDDVVGLLLSDRMAQRTVNGALATSGSG
jgi:hypothetical protein